MKSHKLIDNRDTEHVLERQFEGFVFVVTYLLYA